MKQVAHLAGFFGAHGIWSVSDGATLITMIGYEQQSGERGMMRLVTEKLEDSVAQGRQWLGDNPEAVQRAAVIFDGYITLADGKTDAIFIEARDYTTTPPRELVMAVPYRNAASPNGFAVHKPKLLALPDGEQDIQGIVEAFFAGVDAHEEAAAVWNAHLDESR